MQSDPLGLKAGWNTYAYVGNNPVGGIDPFGLETYLAFHEVGAGFYHAKFVVENKNGRHTFGGGPDGKAWVFGSLHGGVDRESDYSRQGSLGDQYPIDLSGRSCLNEDLIVEKLTQLTKHYNKHHNSFWQGHPYALFPENRWVGQHDYNSNGYARGIGNAAGLNMPARHQIPIKKLPGYNKPVPISSFGIKP